MLNLPQGVHDGTAAPLEIAAFALATRNLASRLVLQPAPSRVENFSITPQMQYMLRESDVRFSYLWEECLTDVCWVENVAVLLVLLSLLGASFQSAMALIVEQGRLDRLSFCHGGVEIAAWLRVGFAVAATLFFLSSFLERGLRRRRTEWAYLCARLNPTQLTSRSESGRQLYHGHVDRNAFLTAELLLVFVLLLQGSAAAQAGLAYHSP